jgi:hypothetical protein
MAEAAVVGEADVVAAAALAEALGGAAALAEALEAVAFDRALLPASAGHRAASMGAAEPGQPEAPAEICPNVRVGGARSLRRD